MQVAEANRCWREEEDGIIDDCTAVVALLNVIASASLPKGASASRPHISKAMKDMAKKTTHAFRPQSLLKASGKAAHKHSISPNQQPEDNAIQP